MIIMRSLLYVLGGAVAILFFIGLVVPDPPARESVSAPERTPEPTSAATAAATASATPRATATTVARVLTAQEACHAAQRMVTKQLKAPSTAKWQGNCGTGRDLTITPGTSAEGLSTWTVTGTVDSSNGFGALIRSTYQATVVDIGPVEGGYVTGGQVDWIR